MAGTDPSQPGDSASASAASGREPEVISSSSSSSGRKPGPDVPEYVKLDEGQLPPDSDWSNDPDRMKLPTYFSRDRDVPSLGQTFNMQNLIPVLVNVNDDNGDTYLLNIHKTNAFFLWNEIEGSMWAFKKANTGSSGGSGGEEEFQSQLKHVLGLILTNSYGGADLVRQYRNRTS